MPPPAATPADASAPPSAQSRALSGISASRPLLDPCNDFVFKTLFVQKPALLLDLVNAVRSHLPPIEDIEILNPAIPPEAIEGKAIVLDLLARDRSGRRFNVEMQVTRQPALPKRSVFYLGRVLSGQLEVGEHYASLAPVIGIHLLDFVYFPDRPGKACWRYLLRDEELGDDLPDSPLELNLVELPKADRLGENDRNVPLSAWVTFLKHAQEPEIMSQIDYPPVREAMDTLRGISEDELNQLHALARKRALMDQAALIEEARQQVLMDQAALIEEARQQVLMDQAALIEEARQQVLMDQVALIEEARTEGIEKGLAEGLEKGERKGEQRAARKLARQLIGQLGLDDAAIARLTGLSETDVKRLRQQPAA